MKYLMVLAGIFMIAPTVGTSSVSKTAQGAQLKTIFGQQLQQILLADAVAFGKDRVTVETLALQLDKALPTEHSPACASLRVADNIMAVTERADESTRKRVRDLLRDFLHAKRPHNPQGTVELCDEPQLPLYSSLRGVLPMVDEHTQVTGNSVSPAIVNQQTRRQLLDIKTADASDTQTISVKQRMAELGFFPAFL